jgi:hypothetical protein
MVALALGILGAAFVLAGPIRDRGRNEVVTITGSAKRSIESDQIQWSASLTSQQGSTSDATRELNGWTDQTRKFLRDAGVRDDELTLNPLSTETVTTNAQGQETGRVTGFKLTRTLEVRSSRVKEIGSVVDKSDTLLEKGVPLAVQAPHYLYTKLADIRPQLLADAAKDAVRRGRRLVEAVGGRLGSLKTVRVGVFQITPRNSTDVSDEGIYDTSSLEKDVTAVVRVTFALR